MARGLAEDRSRRLGRVEMLTTELDNLPEGYEPTEPEVERFKVLVAKINEALFPAPPEAAVEAAVDKGKAGKK